MLGKVKEWLGIEGVKLELVVPENFNVNQGTLSGIIRLRSMRAQTVNAIRLDLIEKYTRGRDEETLVDEYNLGTLTINEKFDVPAEGEPVDVPFEIEFAAYNSPVDDFAQKNILFKGLAWVARKTRNAASEYRLEAEANVKGVALNPFDKKILG